MPAPSKNFTAILDAAIDSGSPITAELMTQIRDSLIHLEEWLGKDYTAETNHNHDGVNSAPIEVGGNSVRNGSFEAGTVSWTTSNYTGGTVATNTANDMDGATCLAITSTVLANGGGEAVTADIACSGGMSIAVAAMIKASTAGVSSKISVLWLDDAKSSISETVLLSLSNTPTSARGVSNLATAPANARFYKVKIVGGVPAVGSAVGTVFFDGVIAGQRTGVALGGDRRLFRDAATYSNSGLTMTEVVNIHVPDAGYYNTRLELRTTNVAVEARARVYVDGVATGSLHSTISNTFVAFAEEVFVPGGSTVQFFMTSTSIGVAVELKNAALAVANKSVAAPSALPVGDR